jgi:hypothetical protein
MQNAVTQIMATKASVMAPLIDALRDAGARGLGEYALALIPLNCTAAVNTLSDAVVTVDHAASSLSMQQTLWIKAGMAVAVVAAVAVADYLGNRKKSEGTMNIAGTSRDDKEGADAPVCVLGPCESEDEKQIWLNLDLEDQSELIR